MLNPHDRELEDFLRRLRLPLCSLPPDAQAEAHQELWQHLDSLIAAHRELGAPEDEAVRAALRSFGNPARVGRQMAHEWRRKQQPGLNGELWAVLFTLAFYTLLACITHSNDIFTGAVIDARQMLIVLAGIPLLTGAVIGVLFPRIAVPAMLYATSAVVSMVWLPALLLLAVEPDAGTRYALKVFTVQAACWLPLSCLAAYGASALRRREFYRVGWNDLKLSAMPLPKKV